MKRALCLLRSQLTYRRESFCSGLEAAGYRVCQTLPDPRPGDVLVIWNRYTTSDAEAKRFERAGADMVVAENGHLRDGLPGKWFSLARNHHNGAGTWNEGGPERWDALGVELRPWRADGETVILGQRSIGEPGIASPRGWEEATRRRVGGRIRPHPGANDPPVPLEHDLRNAAVVVTWHSSAALLALIWGIPVFYDFPKWIGARAGVRLGVTDTPKRDDADRLAMFRRLIWAQWRLEEIASGEAFVKLLQSRTVGRRWITITDDLSIPVPD